MLYILQLISQKISHLGKKGHQALADEIIINYLISSFLHQSLPEH